MVTWPRPVLNLQKMQRKSGIKAELVENGETEIGLPQMRSKSEIGRKIGSSGPCQGFIGTDRQFLNFFLQISRRHARARSLVCISSMQSHLRF